MIVYICVWTGYLLILRNYCQFCDDGDVAK